MRYQAALHPEDDIVTQYTGASPVYLDLEASNIIKSANYVRSSLCIAVDRTRLHIATLRISLVGRLCSSWAFGCWGRFISNNAR